MEINEKQGEKEMKRNTEKQQAKELLQILKYIEKQYTNVTMERVIDYCIKNNFDRTALKTYEIIECAVQDRKEYLDLND